MRITGGFPITAKVDKKGRRIVGLIVPFGETGYAAAAGEPIDLQVEAGGLVWEDPNQVKLVIDHNGDKPTIAGKARDLIETDDGIVGTFSVLPTVWGDQALIEASEGLRVGLSIEAEGTAEPDESGTVRFTASNPARLHKVALVENPAFASAQVHEVAAQKANTMPEKITAAEVPDDQLTEVVTALQGIAEALASNLPSEESDVSESAPAEASRPATVPAIAGSITASTAVTREAFPYGHPGAEGQSFFADLMATRKGDTLAAQRVDKAEQIWKITAANEPVAQTNVTIPNVYQDALLVNLPQFPRDICDNIPSTQISSARPILVPVVDSVYADGGSGEPVGSHSEGTNPAQGEVEINYDTFTPGVYSGMFDINREALDAGSPGMDELLFGFLRRSYNNVTEAAAYSSIAGYSGIDTGSSTTDADLQVEARNMEKTIRLEMAAFKARLGAPADIIWANPTQYAGLVGYDASDGRPILPYLAPMNASGQSTVANYDGLGIQGVPLINATYVASAKVVVARRDTIHRWESPTLTFRWEEVAGPAKVRFVAFGYCLTSPIDARGVCLITQA